QPSRAGEPAAAVRGQGFPLGSAPYPPPDADVSAGVSPLRRADTALSIRAAVGRTAGVRAVSLALAGPSDRLGQSAEPGAAAAAGGRPAAPARHRTARSRCITAT